jgi:hypothetical protein
MDKQLDLRKTIAQQIGELIVANFEQAFEIQRLQAVITELQNQQNEAPKGE